MREKAEKLTCSNSVAVSHLRPPCRSVDCSLASFADFVRGHSDWISLKGHKEREDGALIANRADLDILACLSGGKERQRRQVLKKAWIVQRGGTTEHGKN